MPVQGHVIYSGLFICTGWAVYKTLATGSARDRTWGRGPLHFPTPASSNPGRRGRYCRVGRGIRHWHLHTSAKCGHVKTEKQAGRQCRLILQAGAQGQQSAMCFQQDGTPSMERGWWAVESALASLPRCASLQRACTFPQMQPVPSQAWFSRARFRHAGQRSTGNLPDLPGSLGG